MLDVGQGDAILIRADGHSALIDAGPRDANVEEQLRTLGVEHLDLVVSTHPHADHIGRMAQVLQDFDVGLYVDNGMSHTTKNYANVMEAVKTTEVDYQVAVKGMSFPFGDEAVFTVLFPGSSQISGTRSDINSNSVVLRLDHGASSFLFMGDAEAPTEVALLKANIPAVDVLKVAHHGSGHSSTGAFLAKLHPHSALISCGEGNRYHHPYDEALERLQHVGTLVYRTDRSGNLRAISDGVGVEILEGTIAELDSVVVVPWPEPVAVVDTDPEEPPEPDETTGSPSVDGPKLKRRDFFDAAFERRPHASKAEIRSEWRAYKKAWRLAQKLERKAAKALDNATVEGEPEP